MAPCVADIPREKLAEVCDRYGVARLRVFGSAVRDDFDPARSDIDVLVDFKPGASRSLFVLVDLQDALAEVFARRVDVLTPAGLSRYFRDEVLAEAEPLYVAS